MLADQSFDLSFYIDMVRTLEEINAPYVIIGGFAAALYGSNRATHDIDIVVDLQEQHIAALAAHYPGPRYYADPQQMRDSIRLGIMFNIIDSTLGQKVDLMPLSGAPDYRPALQRRIRQVFEDAQGNQVAAWFARPEDVIVGKLLAWKEGHSRRHEFDIYSMLVFIFLGFDAELSARFDQTYVDRQAARMGEEVLELWHNLKTEAKEEAESASTASS